MRREVPLRRTGTPVQQRTTPRSAAQCAAPGERTLTLRRQIPTKARHQQPQSQGISMSAASLESTINTAFDARDGISSATRGEVRDAVDHALDLLDKGEVRVAEREAGGKWN